MGSNLVRKTALNLSKHTLFVFASVSSILVPVWCHADQPFYSSNRNPFVDVYGLPAAQGAKLNGVSQFSADLHYEVANSFSQDTKGNEAIFIDGETQRTNIRFRYGISDRAEIGLDIPYLDHDGGSLDGFIDDWHEFWSLPDGNRPDFAQDELQYAYQSNGSTLVNLSRSANGVGDITISGAYALVNEPARQWSLRTSLKLPVGDADKLTGSESTDIALALHVSDQGLTQNRSVNLHGSFGVLWMDGGEVLSSLRHDWVAYGSTTLAWQYSPAISLKLQLDAHSAFYDSALTELGDHAVQLSLGGAINFSRQWVLDLAVIEDIAVATSPDVVFHIGIKKSAW